MGDFEVELLASPEQGGSFDGAGFYNENEVVLIKANPASGYQFVKWDGDVTDAERSLTVTEDISLVATFKPSTTPPEPDDSEGPDII